MLHPPVFMGTQQLPDYLDVLLIVDPRQNDWQIAGNSLRPECGKVHIAPAEDVRSGPQRGVGINHGVGQSLEQEGYFRADAQMVELHLRLRRAKRKGAFKGAGVAVLVCEVDS